MSVKEIAKRVGTSTATVSRVLSDPEYRCRSQELQNKIWDIAQEMNYIPNEAAIALKKGGSSKEHSEYYVNEDEEETLKDTVASALTQSEEKQYAQTLMEHGVAPERIRKYGFAFEGKKVLIG